MSSSSLSVDNVAGQLAEKQRTTNDEIASAVSPLLLADNNVGGPIEDTSTAIQKMIDAGFDSDVDINAEQAGLKMKEINFRYFTPMVYFCHKGDLQMCRYLFVNGASTQTNGRVFLFPMYAAALVCNLDVCKWLYEHGAQEDVQKRNSHGYSPLAAVLSNLCNNTVSTTRWLILNGVISSRNNPRQIDEALLNRDLQYVATDRGGRRKLRLWVEEELKTHNQFLQFLCAEQTKQIFGGKSGILQHIADFAGVVRGKDLSILRQLRNFLRVLIQDLPVGQFSERYGEHNSESSGDSEGENDSASNGEDNSDNEVKRD